MAHTSHWVASYSSLVYIPPADFMFAKPQSLVVGFNFSKLMQFSLETPRLRLRPLTTNDRDRIHEMWTEPGVRKFLFDDKIVKRDFVTDSITRSQSLFDERGFGLWGFSFKAKTDLIGFGGFWYFHEPPELELLFGLTTAHWGKGLATEAATALIRYGFEVLRFDRIQACADGGNLTSQRVLVKSGMRFIKRAVLDGLDLLFYEIKNAESGTG